METGARIDAEVLMLHGTVDRCPDCGDERVLLPSDGFEGFCCTTCDAAVFPGFPGFPELAPDAGSGRAARDVLGRLAG